MQKPNNYQTLILHNTILTLIQKVLKIQGISKRPSMGDYYKSMVTRGF